MELSEMLPEDEKLKSYSNEQLVKLLEKDSGIIRSRVIATLSHRTQDEKLKEVLFNEAEKEQNHSLVFFGSIKVSWVAFIALLVTANDKDKRKLQDIVNHTWPEKEKEMLCGYLKEYKGIQLSSLGNLKIK